MTTSGNALMKLAQMHAQPRSPQMSAAEMLQHQYHLKTRLQEAQSARKEREMRVAQVIAQARAMSGQRWARDMMDEGRHSGLYGAAVRNMDAHLMQRVLSEANDPAAQASGFAMMENQERLQQHLDDEMDKIGGVGSWLGGGLARGASAVRGWGTSALRGVGNALAPPLVSAGAASATHFPGKIPTVLRPPPPAAAAGAALSHYPTHLPPPPKTPGGLGLASAAPPAAVRGAAPVPPPSPTPSMTAPPPAQRPAKAPPAPAAGPSAAPAAQSATPTTVSGLKPGQAPAASPATKTAPAQAAATPAPAPAAAPPAQAAAAPAANGKEKPGFFDTLAKDYESGKLMRNAAILGGVGAIGYGGYKLLQGGLHYLGNEQERPPVYGTGAPMPPVAYGPGGEPIYR